MNSTNSPDIVVQPKSSTLWEATYQEKKITIQCNLWFTARDAAMRHFNCNQGDVDPKCIQDGPP